MTIYLDVGAARIQTWLGRSATLRGRRGASSLLARHTRRDAVEAWLTDQPDLPGVEWNRDAGDVDGIVSLMVTTPATDDELAAAAGRVIAYLRPALPRVELRAAWASADSYVTAYPRIEHLLADGAGLTAGVQPRTVPLAKSCEDCGIDGVVHRGYPIAMDEERDVCADCHARYTAAGRTTATAAELVPGPELDLSGWLWDAAPEHPLMETVVGQADGDDDAAVIRTLFRTIPDDAATLARCTVGRDGRAGTHTALVFADGNRIGEFIERAIGADVDKSHIATWITAANQAAVVAASAAALAADKGLQQLPVAPHLIAGDDLLVSLPATMTWPFVRKYLSAFESRLLEQAERDGVPTAELGLLPSASAGIVFSHHSYPFADTVRLAGTALAAAKRRVRGAEIVGGLARHHRGRPHTGRGPARRARRGDHQPGKATGRAGRVAGQPTRHPDQLRPPRPPPRPHPGDPAPRDRRGHTVPRRRRAPAAAGAGPDPVVAMMTELQFRIEFHGPFRVGTGRAGDGADDTIDRSDPLPASHLKGLMRSAAREVLALPADSPLLLGVFGAPGNGADSPWAWDSAYPVTGTWRDVTVARRVRIAVDDATGTAAPDQLVIGEELWPAPEVSAGFTVRLAGTPPAEQQAHEALLRLAARAVGGVGAQRRRGLGWVTVRPVDHTDVAADLAAVLDPKPS